jgi:hypothetical protein
LAAEHRLGFPLTIEPGNNALHVTPVELGLQVACASCGGSAQGRTLFMRVSLRDASVLQIAAVVLIAVSAALAVAAPPVDSPVPIDFSYAGYQAGRPIPWVKAVLTVKPSGADDTALLQGALDRVASMPPGSDGFRGALLLAPGRFHVKGQLHLRVGGVVLRGAGVGERRCSWRGDSGAG